MTLTFASAADTAAEFRNIVLVFGVLDGVIVAAFWQAGRNSALSMTLMTRCLLGLAALLGIVWYGYASSYQKFISAEVTQSVVKLVFVGPFAREVELAPKDVTDVRFGYADRGSSRCRVVFETSTSSSFRGAWIPDKSNVCKAMREEILRTLHSKSR